MGQNSTESGRVDVLVRTFNSERDLADCLASARACLPIHRLIVVDRNSTDRTREIASQFGAEILLEDLGLGGATTLAIARAETPYLLFLDSDVVVHGSDFVQRALNEFRAPRVGAVVGCAIGHRFLYGLPLSLTVLPTHWARRVRIPPNAQGRETFYLQRALRRAGLRVAYLRDAMEHRSAYRGRDWPEWQGAQTRIAAGWNLRELAYSGLVILLIHVNSRRPRNVLYTPVFYAKFLRGFLEPNRWRLRDRRLIHPN